MKYWTNTTDRRAGRSYCMGDRNIHGLRRRLTTNEDLVGMTWIRTSDSNGAATQTGHQRRHRVMASGREWATRGPDCTAASRQSQSALNLRLEGRGDRVRQALDFQFDPVEFDQGELNKLRQRMETRSPTSGQVESHET